MTVSNDQVIHITMLGKFQITVGDITITNAGSRTHQIWNLLEYLIAFRNKTISQEELIEALWPDGMSNSPVNALKNLVYRTKQMFAAQNIHFSRDLIVFNRGTYKWNNHINCTVDTEEFEQLYRKSTEILISPSEKIEACRRAIMLYTGSFLPDSSYETWVVPLVGYYRAIYFKCVRLCVELLEKAGRYEEVCNICEKAVVIDPYEEVPHKYLILALARQNNHPAALAHYNYVADLFYRELGVKPSEDMRGLYREIVKSINSVETDLNVIKEDLGERSKIAGAFYCDYEVFKNLYRVEVRTSSRKKQEIFIGLLTLTDKKDGIPPLQILNSAMEELLESVRESLRKGDIVSRFSATQYVLMFPSISLEVGTSVMERVCESFQKSGSAHSLKIHSEIRPLDTIA